MFGLIEPARRGWASAPGQVELRGHESRSAARIVERDEQHRGHEPGVAITLSRAKQTVHSRQALDEVGAALGTSHVLGCPLAGLEFGQGVAGVAPGVGYHAAGVRRALCFDERLADSL